LQVLQYLNFIFSIQDLKHFQLFLVSLKFHFSIHLIKFRILVTYFDIKESSIHYNFHSKVQLF